MRTNVPRPRAEIPKTDRLAKSQQKRLRVDERPVEFEQLLDTDTGRGVDVEDDFVRLDLEGDEGCAMTRCRWV